MKKKESGSSITEKNNESALDLKHRRDEQNDGDECLRAHVRIL